MSKSYSIFEKFEESVGIGIKILPIRKQAPFDSMVKILFNSGAEKFYVLEKRETREVQLPVIYNIAKEYYPLLLVSDKTYPGIRKSLKEKGINYIDAAGNTFISTNSNYIFIEKKEKSRIEKVSPARAFTKTGVKVLFHFITNPECVNLTVRNLAEMTGVGNDTIHKISKSLLEGGYLVKRDNKKFKLINREELISEWVKAYKEKLKPKILIGRFSLLNPDLDWKTIELKKNSRWGGEPAGSIITGHLIPSVLTIYTIEKKSEIVKNYQLVPDESGVIFVYEKFWKVDDTEEITVHPLLVYADLVISGDSRNIEIANMIYEKYIRDLF